MSIRRLETTDGTSLSVTTPINLDDYHVTFDRSTNGKDRSVDTATTPQLSFTNDAFLGGSHVKATQNILYSAIVPRYDVLTPTGVNGSTTGIEASIRTVSGTSVSGNETSFIDDGFQDGTQIKYFNDAGTAVAMGATGEIRANGVTFDGGLHAGNVMFVDQFNHGMYSTSNKVK